MKTGLFFLLVFFSLSGFAETFKVMDVIVPENEGEDFLVLASDGRVYEIDQTNTEAAALALAAKEGRSTIDVETSSLKEINTILNAPESIQSIKLYSEDLNIEAYLNSPSPTDNFEPTVISDSQDTVRYFRSMRTDTRRRSQCYNRAYVWNYELWKDYGLKTRKIYLFFTRKYIREYNYGWWFHVAPLAKVNTGSVVTDVVLDREFSNAPQLVEVWKNDYIHNKAACPEVKKYSDYRDHQQEEYCYFIKASMYYWQPLDLENLEKNGTQITDWSEWKLNTAYRNAIR